jgi:hypothetical protein
MRFDQRAMRSGEFRVSGGRLVERTLFIAMKTFSPIFGFLPANVWIMTVLLGRPFQPNIKLAWPMGS